MMTIRIDDNAQRDYIAAHFHCACCGHCCKGDGIVRFGPAEADRMAELLGLTRRRFVRQYALQIAAHEWILRDRMVAVPGGLGLQEKWCIFLEQHPGGLYGCRLHEVKPVQCRDFPRTWQNPDSASTCVGLRALLAEMRRCGRPERVSEREDSPELSS